MFFLSNLNLAQTKFLGNSPDLLWLQRCFTLIAKFKIRANYNQHCCESLVLIWINLKIVMTECKTLLRMIHSRVSWMCFPVLRSIKVSAPGFSKVSEPNVCSKSQPSLGERNWLLVIEVIEVLPGHLNLVQGMGRQTGLNWGTGTVNPVNPCRRAPHKALHCNFSTSSSMVEAWHSHTNSIGAKVLQTFLKL